MSKKIGYVVRVREINWGQFDNAMKILKKYLSVINEFKSGKIDWGKWVNFVKSDRINGYCYQYIPIVFTENMTMQLVKELSSIGIVANYIEYDFVNDIYYDLGSRKLEILYSHINITSSSDSILSKGEYSSNEDEKDIVTYLRGLLVLEKTLLTIEKCKEKINKIVKDKEREIENWFKGKNDQVNVLDMGACVKVAIAIAVVLFLVAPFIFAVLIDIMEIKIFGFSHGDLSEDEMYTLGRVFAIVVGILIVVGGNLLKKYQQSKNEKANNAIQERKKDKLKDNDKYIDMLNKLSNCEKSVKDTLNTLYDADIIENRYRELIPIAEFYDYFTYENATVTKLSGDGGAYSLYEENIDKRAILGNIDMLEDNMAGWIENQPTECECIKEAKNIALSITNDGKLDKFVEQAESICRQVQTDFDRCERYLTSYR